MRRRANQGEMISSATSLLMAGRIPMVSLIQTLAVAEHLNFRHAANVLGVTQSSISSRVKALEETLGIQLFERRHRGVRLTEAGRHFVAGVSAGIGHLDHVVRTVGALATGSEGQLYIGLHTSIAAGFLAELRQRYRKAYPGIELVIAEGRSSETIGQVRDGRLDVAFVVNTPPPPDCHSRELWREPIVAALPVSHPLAASPSVLWRDLVQETFLVRTGASGPQVFEHVVRRVAERGVSPQVHRRDVGRDTLMHMVATGEGITLTTEAASHVTFPGVVFLPIGDEPEAARFSAIWSPHNGSPALKNLLDLAIQMRASARAA